MLILKENSSLTSSINYPVESNEILSESGYRISYFVSVYTGFITCLYLLPKIELNFIIKILILLFAPYLVATLVSCTIHVILFTFLLFFYRKFITTGETRLNPFIYIFNRVLFYLLGGFNFCIYILTTYLIFQLIFNRIVN
jgi:hypothetical protein